MACVQFGELCHIAGTDVYVDWQYTEDDGVTPVDLTGATAEMQYLLNANDLTSTHTLTGGITDAANGLGQFTLTDIESQALLPVVLDGASTISFVSHLMLTYSDTTKEVIAGVNSTYSQSLIR